MKTLSANINNNIVTYKLGSKKLGELSRETNVFHRDVFKTKHLFRKSSSWAIDSTLFKILLAKGSTIEIHEVEENIVYYIPAHKFDEHKQFYHFKLDKSDYGLQVFCQTDKFQLIKN